EKGLGDGFEELLVALALGGRILQGGGQLLALLPQLFRGDPELLEGGAQLRERLRGRLVVPGPLSLRPSPQAFDLALERADLRLEQVCGHGFFSGKRRRPPLPAPPSRRSGRRV